MKYKSNKSFLSKAVVALGIAVLLLASAIMLNWTSVTQDPINAFAYYDNAEMLSRAVRNGQIEQSDPASFTVLVHGLNGNASHWSNNGKSDGKDGYQFEYNSNSMIEMLRKQTGGLVYKAAIVEKPTYIKYHNGEVSPYDVGNDKLVNTAKHDNQGRYVHNNENSDRREIEKFQLNLNLLGDTNYNNETRVDTLQDFNRHSIIVFEATGDSNDWYNSAVFFELRSVLDKLSVDFMNVNGKLPRINLIGHSRGGLVNMMYAIERPQQVASIQSMGTPYDGINLNNVLDQLPSLASMFGLEWLVDTKAYEDIVNPRMINHIRDSYNAVSKQYNIQATAISGTTTADYLRASISKQLSGNFTMMWLGGLANGLLYVLDNPVMEFFNGILGIEAMRELMRPIITLYLTVSVVISIPTIINGAAQGDFKSSVEQAMEGMSEYLDTSKGEVEQEVEQARRQGRSVLSFIVSIPRKVREAVLSAMLPLSEYWYDRIINSIDLMFDMFDYQNHNLVITDDFTVDSRSQSAPGFNGFERRNKLFLGSDIDNIKVQSTPFITHYLETHDKEIINLVSAGVNAVKESSKTNRYDLPASESNIVTQNIAGGLKVVGYNGQVGNNVLIPSYIAGTQVVAVGGGITQFRNNTNIQTIYLGQFVQVVENKAFENNANFATLHLERGSRLQEVQDSAFANSDLTDIRYSLSNRDDSSNTLPSTITNIEKGNFAKTKWLASVLENRQAGYNFVVGDNYVLASKVGKDTTLQFNASHKILSDFSVVGDKTYNGTFAGVKIDNSRIHANAFNNLQFKQLDAAYNNITDGSDSIPQYAFANNTILDTVNLQGVGRIDKYAFSNATNLQNITLPASLAIIDDNAFYGATKLNEVKVLSVYPPDLGNNVFGNTASDLKFFVAGDSLSAYQRDWATQKDRIQVLSFNFEVKSTSGINLGKKIELAYYSNIGIMPEVRGYNASEFYHNGNLYGRADLFGKDIADFDNLIINLKPIDYWIDFYENGKLLKSQAYNIENTVEFAKVEDLKRANYNSTFSTDKILPGTTGNQRVEVSYKGQDKTINLVDNFTKKRNSIIVTYGDAFIIPQSMLPATRHGYNFNGFEDQYGTLITNDKGASLNLWMQSSTQTLTARYTPFEFTLDLGNNNTLGLFGVGKNDTVSVDDKLDLKNNQALRDYFKKDGYDIEYFYNSVNGQRLDFVVVPVLGHDLCN
ncbi:MAG: leucine-rich repeat protein [Clostridiales bacterium]|jgi:pimeloyl-ACP methyl ester carboxylesterase|nr:leucine-rich repeat protein [Clostridiales bacterium]